MRSYYAFQKDKMSKTYCIYFIILEKKLNNNNQLSKDKIAY